MVSGRLFAVGILITAVIAVTAGWRLKSLVTTESSADVVINKSARVEASQTPQVAAAAGESQTGEDTAATVVQLPPAKIAALQIGMSEAKPESIRQENLVPGRLQYDDRRHVAVRSATAGVITQILVSPGDQVAAGDVLVELNSAEIGLARADVLQRRTELELAADHRGWLAATTKGLAQLSDAIRRRVPVEEIRKSFQDVTIGRSREPPLSAYSDLLLAESLVTSAQQISRTGALSGRAVEERLNQRTNAEATLLSALEARSFEAGQESQQAVARVEDAERRLRISLQNVRTLLGRDSSGDDSASPMDGTDADTDLQPESLSVVRLKAPFAGTIERRMFSRSERVDAGDSLLILADTSTLWVAADLREREWNALSLKPGDPIRVATFVPGLEALESTVHFVGREVDPTTNAVPLIAVVDNKDGKLRPGMFVRVAVPISNLRTALVVPESAVLEHENRAFVFVKHGDAAFERVDILTGLRANGAVEVVSGLVSGQQVVSAGGFSLKSELLLQGEEQE